MRTSDEVSEVFAALSLARKGFSRINKSQRNSFLGSRYADLSDIYAATTEALSDNGLALMSGSECSGDGMILVTTRLVHKSGQWIETSIVVPIIEEKGTNRLQAIGRSVSYGVRYNTGPLLAVAAEDDGDGASTPAGERRPETTREPKADEKKSTEITAPMNSASVDFHIGQEVKRLVGGRTDPTAKQEMRDLYTEVWGSGIDSWAKVLGLPLQARRRGLARLEAMQAQQPPPAEEASSDDGDVPEAPAIGPDGYVAPGEVEVLRLWAETHGKGELWHRLMKSCPGYPDDPKVTPHGYEAARNAIEIALERKAQEGAHDA